MSSYYSYPQDGSSSSSQDYYRHSTYSSSSRMSSSPPSGGGDKLPPISSLIPPTSPYGMPGPSSNPGYLAPPAGMSSPPLSRHPGPSMAPQGYMQSLPPGGGGMMSPGQYHEFSVGPYALVRESSQQDRPFKCDLCPNSFSRNHDLKRHRRIHMASKPFPCPHCDKCFSRKDALKVRQDPILRTTPEGTKQLKPC